MAIEFGQGEHHSLPELISPARYIDLAQELTRGDTAYTDFEGLADPTQATEVLHNREVTDALNGGEDFVRDLTAHWLYENLDQGGKTPTVDETLCFIFTLHWLFTSRYYLRSDAE